MKDYKNYSDEELIVAIRDADKENNAENKITKYAITEYIIKKYKDLVKLKAQSMYILGGDSEDTIQEGMIGLFKAIRDYDAGRDASFKTFAEICISRQIYTAIQTSQRMKHAPLNTYISIYAKIENTKNSSGEKSEDAELIGMLSEEQEESPEEILLRRERLERLAYLIETELSSLEKQVFELYLTGINYVEIAKILGRDEKSTDNALQRVKTKLKKEMEKW